LVADHAHASLAVEGQVQQQGQRLRLWCSHVLVRCCPLQQGEMLLLLLLLLLLQRPLLHRQSGWCGVLCLLSRLLSLLLKVLQVLLQGARPSGLLLALPG
jgi:hypothetical protein